MDVVESLEVAIAAVEEARSVPLSASCVLNRGEMLQILDKVKVSFPSDLAKAIAVLRDKDQILESAREQADAIIAQSREEVARLVEQTSIVANARKEAQKIMAEVNAESDASRDEIDEYIDTRLATLEVVLNKTLDVISKGRDQLDGFETKHALSELKK
ncbi:MAG: ATP synthase subunit B/B' [Candidatus Nanopelagicaceae bacterium]|nr:ATP synthase subunit B/B' [Candidatus Nanopelagicaceae bacterium]